MNGQCSDLAGARRAGVQDFSCLGLSHNPKDKLTHFYFVAVETNSHSTSVWL